jgi:tetratricopeptide (TPR) repeat protein
MVDHSPDDPLPPTILSGPSTGGGRTLGVGDKIGNRYTITALLGVGGMGAVYKAWDAELGVPVAIKTIAFSAGTEPGARSDMERRFKREVQLARQITHRNVVRIHDLGDVDGTKYLTMALVDGETLAALIRRVGAMPVPDVLNIARQIADGLVAAHEVGVIHRDLKPENVMVTPTGHAYIMDFGIALSSSGVTQTGVIAGTFEYMAPEQSQTTNVDGRADIYAFGLILYDMLTGRKRLQGRDQPMSELISRMSNAPVPVRTLRAEIPQPLETLIIKMTQPSPEARFADAEALREVLNRLDNDGHLRPDTPPIPVSVAPSRSRLARAAIAVAGALLIAGIAWRGYVFEPPAPAAAPQPVSVIVSNFENRTGDPIFDGLIEQALSVGIESATFINVYPRATAMRAAAQYPDKTVSVDTAKLIALREGMGAVITGAIEQTPAGYRLPLQVLKPDTSSAVLLETSVEASGKDAVLDAVGRLATQVRRALGDPAADVNRVNVNETFTANSLDAAAAYIQGQNLLAEGNPEAALGAYEKAVTIDPNFGRAWSGMGAVANNLRRRDEAQRYYDRALQNIDRMTEREKYRTRGSYYAAMGNTEEARRQNEALVQRFPSDAAGLSNLALANFSMWDFPRALEVGRQAAALYPSNVLRQSNVALYAMYASDFATAIAQANRVLELNKDYPRGHLVLAITNFAEGRIDPAIERYNTLAQLPAPGKDLAVHGLADVARYRGRLAEAAEHYTDSLAIVNTPATRARLLVSLASVRLAQGRTAEAAKLATGIELTALDVPGLAAAGEVLAAAGREKEATAIADTLMSRVGLDAQAFGAVIAAQLEIASGNAAEARRRLIETRKQADAWLVRFWLGRAYLATNMFSEAEDEFETCLRRRGEAASVFLDDFPTYYRWLDVHYYHGVARQGLKVASAIDSFKTFLAPKEGGDETGGLVADARKRVAGR